MASNASSIGVAKVATAIIPEGVSASSEPGGKFVERVIGRSSLPLKFL